MKSIVTLDNLATNLMVVDSSPAVARTSKSGVGSSPGRGATDMDIRDSIH